jgi:nitrate reductase gamma subunit
MMTIQILMYVAVAVLLFGTLAKASKISQMPLHLRWDLYPIPHEKGKEHYGGSYYEELNWWTKPANFSLSGEIKEMAAEIFAIKTLYRHNRGLWVSSFPFHMGLYALTGFAALLIAGAVMLIYGVEPSAASPHAIARLVYGLTLVAGVAGWLLGIVGSLGLIFTRAASDKYRTFTTRSDYFNLLLLLALFVCGLAAWVFADRSFDSIRGFVASLISFVPASQTPSLVKAELILTAVFFAYLPFTHMTHFMGKFFTYHRVRWQDEPNLPKSKIEKEVTDALSEPVSWAAPHMSTGKPWLIGATKKPGEPGREGK